MRFVRVAAVAIILFSVAGCSGSKVFLNFSSPDGTPLRDGEVIVRYGYITELVRDPSGVMSPRVSTVSERFPGCESSVSFEPPGEIMYIAVDAIYPRHIPLRFRIERAAADAPRLYELSEIDPQYIPSDLTVVGEKRRVSVSATLRFP